MMLVLNYLLKSSRLPKRITERNHHFYRSPLRNLIRKLKRFLTNKNMTKNNNSLLRRILFLKEN